MKQRQISLVVLAALLMPPWEAFAAPFTFEVVATFDYPGANAYTSANGIDERGDVAGTYLDQNSVYRGFVRFNDGRFSDPITEPNALDFTFASGINSSRTVCGSFLANGGYEGYILSGGIFTEFALSALHTFVGDLNDMNNFCGETISPNQGFVSIDSAVTILSIEGGDYTSANCINNLNQVVGSYTQGGETFGFYRDADGTLTYPIAVASAIGTTLYGLNDRGLMVGIASFGRGTRAVLFNGPNRYVLYSVPGATDTYFADINNRGLICGSYFDQAGRHGFLARVRPATLGVAARGSVLTFDISHLRQGEALCVNN